MSYNPFSAVHGLHVHSMHLLSLFPQMHLSKNNVFQSTAQGVLLHMWKALKAPTQSQNKEIQRQRHWENNNLREMKNNLNIIQAGTKIQTRKEEDRRRGSGREEREVWVFLVRALLWKLDLEQRDGIRDLKLTSEINK